ncbi:MAG: hypothetical protein HY721_27830, partial [Planctomycetes bacterium]|nr:hypothetical protein [Planctomycetota bacterium]
MNAGLRTDALPPPLRRASAASWGVLACAASACAPAAFAGAGPAVELPRPLRGDLAIELFAREPDIVTPVAVDVDRRGRVWAIESNTHFPLPDYKRHPSDRILVIDDTTGDGAADRFHVFADGLHQTMAIALRDGGRLFAATRREVMVFEDPDGDDRPDRRATLARLETAEQYPHNGLTGFAFDGRGRTFFAIGENMGVEYTLTAADGSRVAGGPEGGSIFRMTEDGKELERWALGFWNTFHMAVDPTGSLFAVDNDPDSRPPCRLLHIVRGGDYGYRRWLGRKGLHPFTAWNGELPGTLPMVSGTGEGPSGIAVYNPRRLGLPSDLRGKVLVTSWGDHRIEVHALEPRGASYRSSAEPIVQGGASFRPVGIAAAPDGTVYFSDWVDESYNAHGKGRIWRLRAVPSTGSGGTGASGGTSAEGGNGAAGATGSTPPGGLDPAPLEPVRPPAPPLAARLEALLALGRDGAVEPARAVEAVLAALAGDRDPFLEGAAVDALARAAGAEALLAARGAREAEDPRVRLLLLLALRRTADPKARDALEGFLRDPDLDVRR